MTFQFSEFPGIDQNQVNKLREVDIESTDDLMRLWADEPKRASLATETGISLEQLSKYASMARLARVKNVGPKHVELLMAAGIDGPRSLFEYTPASLVMRLGEVKAEKKLMAEMPELIEIQSWFLDVKPVVVGS